jgi:hypothetical protein
MSSNTKKISDILEEREKKCNDITIYEYKRPKKDPYEYEDIESFEKENPFDKDKNCEVLIPENDIITDKYNRYYKDIYTPARCKTANGFWVGSTVNRNNNYEKGNCWKEEEDAECGGLLNNYKLIRKKDYENGNVSRNEIKSARSTCEINPKCYFKRISEFKRDCVSRKRVNFNKSENDVKSKKSSSSKKSNKNLIDLDNIEKSLQEFYNSKNAPPTAALIGKGNRCVDNYVNSKSPTKSKTNEEIANIDKDIINEDIESRMEYINDVLKLEHLYDNISLEEFQVKYYDFFTEYIQYILLNLDPNDKDNYDVFMLYLEPQTSKNFKDFVNEYNKYISVQKKMFTVGYNLQIPKGENKYYYKYVSILYQKYFPKYFDAYDEKNKYVMKTYEIMHKLFIKYLIETSDPYKDEKWLLLYMNDRKLFDDFKLMYGYKYYDYPRYFPEYFNIDIDIYIEKIKKNYYTYGRFFISRTDPLDEKTHFNLGYFINNRDPELIKKFIKEYKEFHAKSANIMDFFSLYNKYFTRFYEHSIDLEYIYYIKNKIYHLDPNYKEDYEELKKYITDPSLMKEFKTNYNLIEKNIDYDNDLLKLHKKYFSDYFHNIEKKYSTVSSYASSSATPVISEPSSSSSLKPSKLPTIPQSIINNICKIIHHKKIDKRGMLIWHSTGSGKTCTATSIMEGFWGTDMDIIYCSKIEALSANPPKNFYECAQSLFPRFANKTISQIEKEFKNIRFLSFAKLANRIANNTINLNNCILIIDEVHNLFRPLPNQKKQHEYLEKLLLDQKKFPKLKVFILTATLGDNPNEIIKLLNIVKNNNVPKIEYEDLSNIDVFKQKIRGLISYFDMSGDISKFPVVIDNEPKFINMSNKQFEAYIEKYNEVKDKKVHTNYDKLAAANSLQKYWMAARKYSNMLYKFEKGTTLDIFSPKLKELLTSVLSYNNEKQYVYSAFYENKGYGGHGILAVALELNKNGYEQLNPSEAKRILENPKESDKKLRYILAITTQLGEDKGKTLSEMVKLYNSPINKNGEYVQLFLASQSFNEGIDLKGVRHIHIFEPLITWASDKQTIGRAARYCSHSDLRLKEWTVNIHRYISNFPEEIVQDEGKLQQLKDLNKEKDALLEQYAEDLKDQQTKFKNGKAKMTKLIKNASKKSPSEVKRLGDILKDEIAEYNSNIETIKKNISGVKDEIKLIKKELKTFDGEKETKGKKKGLKLDPKGVENIDKLIYKQAIDKMKEILTLYQVMQESAVDCLVLNNFHKTTNNTITCTAY